MAQLLAGGLGRDWWSWEVETKESAGRWMWVLREDRVQVSGEELPVPELGGWLGAAGWGSPEAGQWLHLV